MGAATLGGYHSLPGGLDCGSALIPSVAVGIPCGAFSDQSGSQCQVPVDDHVAIEVELQIHFRAQVQVQLQADSSFLNARLDNPLSGRRTAMYTLLLYI